MQSNLAFVSNNPLSIDRIKLSEKLQAVSAVDRLFIPEEFSVLALSYLNKQLHPTSDTESQLVASSLNSSINDTILLPNGEEKQNSKNIEVNLESHDFIIPPSIESPAVTLGQAREKEENESETIQKSTKLPCNPLTLVQTEELEDWLDDLI